MSEPFPMGRAMADLDDMLASIGGAGWEGLERQFAPAKVPDKFEPQERLKRFMAALFASNEGREMFQWIADLTLRAPYPEIGPSFAQAAMAAKAHEARVAVGRVILQAVADGETLLKTKVPE